MKCSWDQRVKCKLIERRTTQFVVTFDARCTYCCHCCFLTRCRRLFCKAHFSYLYSECILSCHTIQSYLKRNQSSSKGVFLAFEESNKNISLSFSQDPQANQCKTYNQGVRHCRERLKDGVRAVYLFSVPRKFKIFCLRPIINTQLRAG